MLNIKDFVTECAQSMNEAFFGRQVDLRRQTALGDFRNTRFEGASALDFVCEYIHNNLLNLRRNNRVLTYATLDRPSFSWKTWLFTVKIPDNIGYCSISILPERRISEDEAFATVLSDEFDEKLHDLLRNCVYSEKKRDHKFMSSDGRVRSFDSGTFMASVADCVDRHFTVEHDGVHVEVSLTFSDFSISSTVRDDVLDRNDDRPRANVGHIDGGIYRQLDKYSFGNVKPDIPD